MQSRLFYAHVVVVGGGVVVVVAVVGVVVGGGGGYGGGGGGGGSTCFEGATSHLSGVIGQVTSSGALSFQGISDSFVLGGIGPSFLPLPPVNGLPWDKGGHGGQR